MEFFILVLINIFMAALFYLIISLKLERSASSFREQKLRREMDEIITEFNSAAERNISLLEDRIKRYRQLLKQAGDYEGLDLLIDDRPSAPVLTGEKKERDATALKKSGDAPDDKSFSGETSKEGISLGDLISFAGEKIKAAAETTTKKIRHYKKSSGSKIGESDISEKKEVIEQEFFLEASRELVEDPIEKKITATRFEKTVEHRIQRTFEDILPEIISGTFEETPVSSSAVTEEEILKVMNEAGDRFSLVANLTKIGLTTDEISSYSGIPEGEIMLIVNLNGGM